jgi:hypothetical protein
MVFSLQLNQKIRRLCRGFFAGYHQAKVGFYFCLATLGGDGGIPTRNFPLARRALWQIELHPRCRVPVASGFLHFKLSEGRSLAARAGVWVPAPSI